MNKLILVFFCPIICFSQTKIDGISGATISVNSLKIDVYYKTFDLKELIK